MQNNFEKKYTEEDKQPHISSAAVIFGKDGRVLVQKHLKLNNWTLPGGKGSLDSNPFDVLKKEVFEECGITIVHAYLIKHETFDATPFGLPVQIPLYVYVVTSYEGEIQNKEQEKHPIQAFLDPFTLHKIGEPISRVLTLYMEFIQRINGPID